MEKDKTSRVVHREIEQFIGKAVFLFFIIGVAIMAPLSVDIYLSVTAISQSTLSMEQASITYFVGLLGMILGVLLFVFWDRHYSSRDLEKTSSTRRFLPQSLHCYQCSRCTLGILLNK
jgi:uncharacterized metal-binding protein